MGQFIEVARNSVQTWETDQMGHMNVQFYLDKATQGLAAFGHHLGFGPRLLRSRGQTFAALDHHVRFLREQRPGAPFHLKAGILEVGDDTFRVYQEMINTVSGDVAATFAADVALVDDEMGERLPLPGGLREASRAFQVDLPAHGAPRGLTLYAPRPAPTLDEAEGRGMLPTYQGEVQASMCDASGRMVARHFMGIVSDSIPNLLGQTRGDDRSANTRTGGAALEYRFVYRSYPKAGDLIALRSGLKEVTAKTYTWCHWMFDLETGRSVATAEAVAIALDLETRRAIPIPDDMRERLETLVIPDLGV